MDRENIFTRFESIYSNRDEAIKRLNNLSRYYAETVAIRYFDTASDEIYLILAIYLSDKKGDYKIYYDTRDKSYNIEIYKFYRKDISVSDKDCIIQALNGSKPKTGDIIQIIELTGNTICYIYNGNFWTIISDNNFRIDNDTLIYDEKIGSIRVNKIKGGTF